MTLKRTCQQVQKLWEKDQGLTEGNVTEDASTNQKTSILLQFMAAYASESISAKAGDLIKNCRTILIQVYLER